MVKLDDNKFKTLYKFVVPEFTKPLKFNALLIPPLNVTALVNVVGWLMVFVPEFPVCVIVVLFKFNGWYKTTLPTIWWLLALVPMLQFPDTLKFTPDKDKFLQ